MITFNNSYNVVTWSTLILRTRWQKYFIYKYSFEKCHLFNYVQGGNQCLKVNLKERTQPIFYLELLPNIGCRTYLNCLWREAPQFLFFMQWPHKGDKSHCGSCLFPPYYKTWTRAYLPIFSENLFIKPKPYDFLSLMSSAFHKLKEVWQLKYAMLFLSIQSVLLISP